MSKKVLGILVAFAMVAMTSQAVFGGGKSDAPAAKIVIKLSDQINEQNPHFKADEFFAKTLAEKSGGSIEVKVFPNSQLGNAREGLEGVLSGSLEVVKVSAAELSTYSSKFSVFSLPYVFTKKSEVFAALDGTVGEILTKELENKGYKLLAFYDTGFRSIFNGKRPINGVADMKGLKIRVINDPIMIETVNSLGGLATPLAYGELYMALKQGVVDGAEQPPVALHSMKFYEVSKFFSLTNHFYDLNVLVMSKKFFDTKLSAAQQKAVNEAGKAVQDYERQLWADYEKDVIGKIVAAGMPTNELDLTPFKQIALPIIEKNKAKVGEDIVNAALSYSGK